MTNSYLRTPAHFGTLSLKEAVAVENSSSWTSYDKTITHFFDGLHKVQGVDHDTVDLTLRVPALAANRTARFGEEYYALHIVNHLLHITYAHVLKVNGLGEYADKLDAIVFQNGLPDEKAILEEISEIVNERLTDQIALWHGAIKARKDAEKAVAVQENLEKKGNEDADVEGAVLALADREEEYAQVRRDMEPIRRLEAVSRFLTLLFPEDGLSHHDRTITSFNAIVRIVSVYRELFASEVKFADGLLRFS